MRFFRSAMVVLALVAVLVAPAAQAQGKTITVSWLQEPDTLNPLYSSMTFTGYTYQLFLAPAWNLDRDLNPTPVLVSEMPSVENGGISADGTTFTLKLKDGLTWSDGDPLDSADFVFTYEMLMADGNAVASREPYNRMVSVEAPDANTVVFSFAEAYVPWLSLWTSVLPEHVLRPVFEAEGSIDFADFNRNPTVASGPYVFETWEVGSFMRFRSNPSYVLGQPKIDTVVLTFVPDDVAYVAGLINGDSDLGTFVAFSDVPALEDAGLTVEVLPSGYNEGWFLNHSPERAHPAMQDVRVRRAIAMGFNRDAFNEDLNYGATFTPSGYWENTPYDNPNLEPYPFDPAAAAALLDEAGWVDGNGDGVREKDGVDLVIRFITNTRGIRRELQAVAQQQLGEIGIKVELSNFPSDQYFAGYADGGPISTGQYEIAELSTKPGGFPDPDTVRFLCSEIPSDENPIGANDFFYCNPEVDALFAAQATELDYEKRIELFHQIDALLYEDVVWVGIWHDADVWIHNPRISGVNLNAVTPWWDIQNWDIEG
jgi:peptide/nickel transport system substrate-binding protein